MPSPVCVYCGQVLVKDADDICYECLNQACPGTNETDYDYCNKPETD